MPARPRPAVPAHLGLFAAGLAVALASGACAGGADADGPARVRVDTLGNGVVRVVSTDPEGASGAELWRIEEDLRIGGDDPRDPSTFSQVAALGVGPDGTIVVADAASRELRVFAADGRWLRTLGRKGGGPGEFEGVSGIAWDAQGVMWVADPGNARYARYGPDGAYLGAVRTATPGAVLPWLGALGEDGFLYDAAARVVDGAVSFRYFRLDRRSGEVVDTFPGMAFARPPVRGAPAALFRVLPRLTFRLAADGTLWFGETDRYRLVVRTLEGDTLRVVDVERPRVPITDAERDSLVREIRDEPPVPGEPFDLKDIPGVKPAFDRIHFDDAGHVIVEPGGPPEEAGRVFDVFDREGRLLGRARSDVTFRTFPALPVFRHGAVVGVVIDPAGYEVVVRARIRPRERG